MIFLVTLLFFSKKIISNCGVLAHPQKEERKDTARNTISSTKKEAVAAATKVFSHDHRESHSIPRNDDEEIHDALGKMKRDERSRHDKRSHISSNSKSSSKSKASSSLEKKFDEDHPGKPINHLEVSSQIHKADPNHDPFSHGEAHGVVEMTIRNSIRGDLRDVLATFKREDAQCCGGRQMLGFYALKLIVFNLKFTTFRMISHLKKRNG